MEKQKRKINWSKIGLVGLSVVLALTLVLSGYQFALEKTQTELPKVVLKVGIANAYSGTPDYVGLTNVQVQQALDALPVTGGEIDLISPVYTFSGVVSRAINNVTIKGINGTTVNWNGLGAVFSVGAQTGWVFQDLKTDAGSITNYTSAELRNVTLGLTYFTLRAPNIAGNISAPSATITTGAFTTLNAPTGRGATIKVAAFTASTSEKNQADYTLTSATDQATMTAAIAALPGLGTTDIKGSGEVTEKNQSGCLELSSGVFSVKIDLSGISDVTLKGQGCSTVVNNLAVDGSNAIQAINTGTAKNRVIIRDLLVQGNTSSGDGVYLQDVDYPQVLNVYSQANGGSGLHIKGGVGGSVGLENRIINGCQFLFNDDYGIYLDAVHETLISETHSEENDLAGFYATDCFNVILSNCSLEDGYGDSQLKLNNCRSVNIANNSIEGGTTAAIYIIGKGDRYSIVGNAIEASARGIRIEGSGAPNSINNVSVMANTFYGTTVGTFNYVNGLSIVGNNPGTIIEGTEFASGIFLNNDNNVTVSGNTLWVKGVGVAIDTSNNVTVNSNTIVTYYLDSSNNGSRIIRAANTCSNLLIKNNNLIKDAASSQDMAVGIGIENSSVNLAIIDGNNITGAVTAISNSGTGTKILNNQGYIAPGEIRTYSGTISTLTQDAFNSIDNPFGQAVRVLNLQIDVSTAATATSPNIDCGIGSSATTDYTTLFDDLPGETIGYYTSTIVTPGTQTVPQTWNSGSANRYLNMSIKDTAATGMVATYTVTVMGN